MRAFTFFVPFFVIYFVSASPALDRETSFIRDRSNSPRDLGDIFGDDSNEGPAESTTDLSYLESATGRLTSNAQDSKTELGVSTQSFFEGLFTTISSPSRTASGTNPVSQPTTLQSAQNPRTTSSTDPTMSIANLTTTTPTSTPTLTHGGIVGDTAGELAEWRVIGIVVIISSSVGLSILVAMYWDQGKKFLRDLICGNPDHSFTEDLVPDWSRQTWDFKLKNGESRYPFIDDLVPKGHSMDNDVAHDTTTGFPTRPSPVHAADGSSLLSRKPSETYNAYSAAQPGCENPHIPVQLPSANIFGINS